MKFLQGLWSFIERHFWVFNHSSKKIQEIIGNTFSFLRICDLKSCLRFLISPKFSFFDPSRRYNRIHLTGKWVHSRSNENNNGRRDFQHRRKGETKLCETFLRIIKYLESRRFDIIIHFTFALHQNLHRKMEVNTKQARGIELQSNRHGKLRFQRQPLI